MLNDHQARIDEQVERCHQRIDNARRAFAALIQRECDKVVLVKYEAEASSLRDAMLKDHGIQLYPSDTN